MRADLVAMTEEDLAAFSNRGTVNRAAKEVAAGAPAGEVVEGDDGAVRATWSDGWEVELPRGRSLGDARCSCLAVGTCRHVVRTVLRYQQTQQAAAPSGPWDPGAITDEALAAHFPRAALAEARRVLEAGVLAELVRSAKPLARLHGLAANVRFRVRDDLNYAAADTNQPELVAVAVWCFRQLPADRTAGFVVTGTPAPAPLPALDAVEALAGAVVTHGLEAAPPHFADDLTRLEATCRASGLVWPAENVAAFAEEVGRYAARDALFDPQRALTTLGELLARADAVRAGTGAVPALLVRGSTADRVAEMTSTQLVGLGCGIVPGRKRTTLQAFFQDRGVGDVHVVARDFADDPTPFRRLGETIVTQGVGLAQLARSEVLVAKARRSASGLVAFGRARCSVTPQAWAWDQLKEPVRVDDFEELRARLFALPPSALRPLRAAEGFGVLAVAGAEGARFDVATQTVRATLRDADGATALLAHPYVSRGREGSDRLLAMLASRPVKFVAGRVALTAAGLTVAPTAVVFEESGRRTAVLPWVDDAGPSSADEALTPAAAAPDPLRVHVIELEDALGALLRTGLRRADEATARRLRDAARVGESLGLGRLPERVIALATEVESKLGTPRWDATRAAALACELAVLLRLAPDALRI